jgi:methionine-rich copper-binding protein CopC
MRIILTIVAVLFAATGPAFAHAQLDHASPTVGSTVARAPKEVVLWFTNKLEGAFSSIEVRDQKGAVVSSGKARVGGDGTQMRVSLKAVPAGTYKVSWRALSVDTHRTQGDFTFRVGP